MDRLSNILKQRLAMQQIATEVEHPSADTLAAFAEQALRAAERQRVFSHLAVCSECRRVIALAASVEEITPAVPSARGYVARFPSVLRWASVAAAFAVAIGIGVLSHEHENRPKLATSAPAQIQEQKKVPPASQRTAEANSPVAKEEAPAVNSRSARRQARVIADNAGRKNQPAMKKAEGAAVVGGLIASSRPKTAFPNSSVADAFMASNIAPAPPPPPAASANGKINTFSNVSAAPAPATVGAPAAPAQLSVEARSNMELADVSTAKKVATQEYKNPARTSLQQQPVSSASMKAVASSAIGGPVGVGAIHGYIPIAHWTISSAGKLQRRTGDGRFASIEPAPGVSIRAVAAQGIEVWAAGSQPDLSTKEWQQRPVLFHSSDAGETWTKIDGPWQSSITTLNLADANILTVVAADGSWTTADAGKNWTRK